MFAWIVYGIGAGEPVIDVLLRRRLQTLDDDLPDPIVVALDIGPRAKAVAAQKPPGPQDRQSGGGIGDNEEAGQAGAPDGDLSGGGTGGSGTGDGGGDGAAARRGRSGP